MFDDIFRHVDTIHQNDRQTNSHRTTAMTAFTHSVAQSNVKSGTVNCAAAPPLSAVSSRLKKQTVLNTTSVAH